MNFNRRARITAIAGLCAVAAAGCSSSAQPKAALGAAGSSPVSAAPKPSAARSASSSSWVIDPADIAMPADITFTWDYTPSGKPDVDQAVTVAEDINRGEIAGIGTSPQNATIIDFPRYATGQTLGWLTSTFANYAQGDGTWLGAVTYDHITTADFTGTGTGESGIVQYCIDATGMNDKVRSTGALTPEGAENYVLITMKLTRVAGGWQAGSLSSVPKDISQCAG